MSQIDQLKEAFSKSLGVGKDKIKDSLSYNGIPEWDSIGHMALIAELESTFDIMLDTEDVINLSSVQKAKEILSKHGIEINICY